MASEKWFRHPIPKTDLPPKPRWRRGKLLGGVAVLSAALVGALLLMSSNFRHGATPQVQTAQPVSVEKGGREIGEGSVELPPMPRFTEYEVGHVYRPAQDALNRGEVTYAVVLFGRRNSMVRPDTDRECRFGIALQRAYDQTAGRTPETRECGPDNQPLAHAHN